MTDLRATAAVAPKPFVSIGITTYRRPDLLRQCVHSILSQDFDDFEILVGNDDVGEDITADKLGVDDLRLKIVNHKHNRREIGNMNELLRLASGRYFMWLADDDLLHPDFLRRASTLLTANDFPPCYYSSYRLFHGTDTPEFPTAYPGYPIEVDGPAFLDGYFGGRFRVISVYGLFDTATLSHRVGGVTELCQASVALYSEYLFLLRCALAMERILYDALPLVYSRVHLGSWGGSNAEVSLYSQAGHALIQAALPATARLPQRVRRRVLLGVCDIHLRAYAGQITLVTATQPIFRLGMLYRAVRQFFAEADWMLGAVINGVRMHVLDAAWQEGLRKLVFGVRIPFVALGSMTLRRLRKAHEEG